MDNLTLDKGRELLERLVLPRAEAEPTGLLVWLPLAALAVPLLAWVTSLFHPGAPGAGERERRALAIVLAWLLGAGALAAWAGPVYSWRTFTVLVGFALTLGVSAEIALGALARGPAAARLVGAAAAAPLFLIVGVDLSQSAFTTGPERWDAAGAAFTGWQDDVRARIEGAGPGAVVLVPPPPGEWLAPHSIRAWLELERPGREVRVVRARRQADVPETPLANAEGGSADLTLVLRSW